MRSVGLPLAAAVVCLLGSCSEPEAPVGGLILQKVAGDNQTYDQGRPLPDTLVVRLAGAGLTGLFVSFTVTEGGGSVSEDVVTPDIAGLVRTVWTLGPGLGRNKLVAFSPGQLLTFTATATPPSANGLEAWRQSLGQAPVDDTVSAAVIVRDIGNVPVAGDTIVFTVTGGGGTIGGKAQDTVLTDNVGVAESPPWRLGTQVGVNTLSASSLVLSRKGRAPVLFTSTSTPLAARRLAIRTMPTALSSGAAPPGIRPLIEVRDSFDNLVPVNGAVVTATLTSAPPGARLMGKTRATAVAGRAPFDSLVVFGPPGSVTLRFTAPALDSAESGTIPLMVGPPSIYTSSVAVAPTTVLAGDSALITLTILDDYGTPVTNFTPDLNTTNWDFWNQPSPTDGQGRSTAWVFPQPIGIAPEEFTDANDLIFGSLGGGFGFFNTIVGAATLQVRSSPGGSLSFLVQPPPLTVGSVLSPAPQVVALDSSGAPMTGFGGSVTIDATTVTAVNGVAVFPNLPFPPPGFPSYRLFATSPGLYSVSSGSYNFFPSSVVLLTVSATGSGKGRITDASGNISCFWPGPTTTDVCLVAFSNFNPIFTLTATPAPGSVFTGWSGACIGVGVCVLFNLGLPRAVTATFQ